MVCYLSKCGLHINFYTYTNSVNKFLKKTNGPSIIDNPGTHTTLGTQDTDRRQTKHRKLKISGKWTPLKPGGEPRFSVRVGSSCFLQDTRHFAPIVKSCNSLVGDRRKINCTKRIEIHCHLRN